MSAGVGHNVVVWGSWRRWYVGIYGLDKKTKQTKGTGTVAAGRGGRVTFTAAIEVQRNQSLLCSIIISKSNRVNRHFISWYYDSAGEEDKQTIEGRRIVVLFKILPTPKIGFEVERKRGPSLVCITTYVDNSL